MIPHVLGHALLGTGKVGCPGPRVTRINITSLGLYRHSSLRKGLPPPTRN
jgi:hypothetical protein